MFGPASADQVRAAQIITGAALVLFLGVGLVPGTRRYARQIQALVLVAYLVACAAFIAYVLALRAR